MVSIVCAEIGRFIRRFPGRHERVLSRMKRVLTNQPGHIRRVEDNSVRRDHVCSDAVCVSTRSPYFVSAEISHGFTRIYMSFGEDVPLSYTPSSSWAPLLVSCLQIYTL